METFGLELYDRSRMPTQADVAFWRFSEVNGRGDDVRSSGVKQTSPLRASTSEIDPLAQVSRQRALPRGDAEVAFKNPQPLVISFGFGNPRD